MSTVLGSTEGLVLNKSLFSVLEKSCLLTIDGYSIFKFFIISGGEYGIQIHW